MIYLSRINSIIIYLKSKNKWYTYFIKGVSATYYSFVFIVQDEFCIGIYDQDAKFWRQSTLNLDKILFIIIVILFFITLGLAIAVFICKKKMLENNYLMAPPKSLESLVLNIAVIGLVVINILCNKLYWKE